MPFLFVSGINLRKVTVSSSLRAALVFSAAALFHLVSGAKASADVSWLIKPLSVALCRIWLLTTVFSSSHEHKFLFGLAKNAHKKYVKVNPPSDEKHAERGSRKNSGERLQFFWRDDRRGDADVVVSVCGHLVQFTATASGGVHCKAYLCSAFVSSLLPSSNQTLWCDRTSYTLNLCINWKIHYIYSAQARRYPHMSQHVHTPRWIDSRH